MPATDTTLDTTLDTTPDTIPATTATSELIDVLAALHHPTRRWLLEILGTEGPATVGRLAARTGLAVGSVSHHLKPLHRQGFIEPAPELARDTRESWWRSVPRSVSWNVHDFEPETLGRRIADRAEAENYRYQVRALQHWLAHAPQATPDWRRAAGANDSLVPATSQQLEELLSRVGDIVSEWSAQCRRAAEARPDAVRRPVRVVVWGFPSEPVRP